MPDKIYAAYTGEDQDSRPSRSSTSSEPKRKRPKYRDASSSESEGGGGGKVSDSEEDDDDDDDVEIPEFNDRKMGKSGEPFTESDMALAARHLASFRKNDPTTWANVWEMFSERVWVTYLGFYERY